MRSFFIFVFCWGLAWTQFTEYVPPDHEEVTRESTGGFGALEKCGEGSLRGSRCVPYYKCDPQTNTTVPETDEKNGDDEDEDIPDYSVQIDIRITETNPCSEQTLGVCCKIGTGQTSATPPTKPTPTPPDVNPTPPNVNPTPDTPRPRLSLCGIRNENGIDFKITGNSHNEAEYGEFPWMVAILKTNYNPSVDPALAICGGSILAPRVVLTGAHCVHKLEPGDLKVRAGEWDTQTLNERFPYQEQPVAQIIVHEGFKEGVLFNDVALLILEQPFRKARHIGTVCLPDQNESVISNECYATGWGKNLFGREGAYQVILKKIDLPIVPRRSCEDKLKETRLGKTFKLHSSFTCAGGVEGKDTCTGDGGSPLVCPDPKNPARYVQAGIVAWGIGCGTTTPGVYADVARFRSWVDGQMQRLKLSTKPYEV